MKLLDLYRSKIKEQAFAEDPAQIKVLSYMQSIADQIIAKESGTPAGNKTGFLRKLFKKENSNNEQWIKGLYCWGGVGRGKTFLMDLFMEYLPTPRKKRRHFHRFMLEVNDELNRLGHIQNPIETVVENMAKEIDILCLDEFFVSDITHAMILDRLLAAMKKRGITIVTTSNITPDNLYKNGLQRVRFLPAIQWIKDNLIVHHIEDGEDFRHRHFNMENIFRTPDSEKNRQELQEDLIELTENAAIPENNSYFQAGSRKIPLLWRNEKALLFDFKEICQGNYSQKDYIEIAKTIEFVGLANVPVLDEYLENSARRFLLMIDEFYDRRVKLLLTTASDIQQIYTGTKMAFEFDRLQSRLFEMQSEDYWNEAHLEG